MSIGGVGAIIVLLGRWLANLTSEAIIKKTEFEFSKKLADFKSELEKKHVRYTSQLDNKSYISRTRFDMEIAIYKQLSGAIVAMARDASFLFPGFERVSLDAVANKERLNDLYIKACESYNLAASAIAENAPFIPQNFFDMFDEIRRECFLQIQWFPDFRMGQLSTEQARELADEKRECYMRNKAIGEKQDLLVLSIRKYLEQLDVLE